MIFKLFQADYNVKILISHIFVQADNVHNLNIIAQQQLLAH